MYWAVSQYQETGMLQKTQLFNAENVCRKYQYFYAENCTYYSMAGNYNWFADTWICMSTQVQAKTICMIWSALMIWLGPTIAPHLHVRTTGHATSKEAEDVLLAAEEIEVPDLSPVQITILLSLSQLAAQIPHPVNSDYDPYSDSEVIPTSSQATQPDSPPSSTRC